MVPRAALAGFRQGCTTRPSSSSSTRTAAGASSTCAAGRCRSRSLSQRSPAGRRSTRIASVPRLRRPSHMRMRPLGRPAPTQPRHASPSACCAPPRPRRARPSPGGRATIAASSCGRSRPATARGAARAARAARRTGWRWSGSRWGRSGARRARGCGAPRPSAPTRRLAWCARWSAEANRGRQAATRSWRSVSSAHHPPAPLAACRASRSAAEPRPDTRVCPTSAQPQITCPPAPRRLAAHRFAPTHLRTHARTTHTHAPPHARHGDRLSPGATPSPCLPMPVRARLSWQARASWCVQIWAGEAFAPFTHDRCVVGASAV